MQIEKCENQHFKQLNQHNGRVAEWLKAPDSKSGVRVTVPWVQIPPLPPPVCHLFTRWRVAKVSRDSLLGDHDFFGDNFD